MNKPDSAVVPVCPIVSPIGKERKGQDRTAKALTPTSLPLKPAVHKPLKVYATVGEEVATHHAREIQRWYLGAREDLKLVHERQLERLLVTRNRDLREVAAEYGVTRERLRELLAESEVGA